MSIEQQTVKRTFVSNWIEQALFGFSKFAPLSSVKNWLNNIEIANPQLAHRVARLIPAQCPFERQINLFGKTILAIPPLCKLNPLYQELVFLRFRAISYLADECGEDISAYC